jgi:hypothetical protein
MLPRLGEPGSARGESASPCCRCRTRQVSRHRPRCDKCRCHRSAPAWAIPDGSLLLTSGTSARRDRPERRSPQQAAEETARPTWPPGCATAPPTTCDSPMTSGSARRQPGRAGHRDEQAAHQGLRRMRSMDGHRGLLRHPLLPGHRCPPCISCLDALTRAAQGTPGSPTPHKSARPRKRRQSRP